MMKGFRLNYLGATISLTIAALARTSTFLLIRYLVDEVLSKGRYGTPLLMVVDWPGVLVPERVQVPESSLKTKSELVLV